MHSRVKLSANNSISKRGFTLSELLVGLTIIAILSSALITSLAGINGAMNLTDASEEIRGVLDQARAQAVGGSTFVWVGFFEEDPTKSVTIPQASGTGQLVLALMASADGTDLRTTVPQNGGSLPGTSLMQVTRLLKIPSVHVDTTISASGAIVFPGTTDSAAPYEVDPTAANASSTTASFPVTGTARYHFSQIIQFNPQGDASEIYTSPTQAMDIGLRPARGNTPLTTGNGSKDVAVIRLEGIGGKVTIYRP